MHPYDHCSTIYNSQDMETTYVSIDRWLDKEDIVPIYNGILLSHKKNEIMPFAATCMQLEILILSEVSQKEKDKYHIYITHMWNLKHSTNDPIYKTDTDSQSGEQTCAFWGRGWREWAVRMWRRQGISHFPSQPPSPLQGTSLSWRRARRRRWETPRAKHHDRVSLA